MHVELIGCTSAGKSTLAGKLLRAGRAHGFEVLTGDDFVLRRRGADWIKGRLARTLLVDLFSLTECLMTWHKNFRFYRFALGTIARMPVARLEKLNLARNVLKKVGIYEIIRRGHCDRQIVLVDEGTLHAAHNLFVHDSTRPSPADVPTFARLVPMPDAAVYVQSDESVLIARTMARGHQRIAGRSHANVARFVTRAVEVFEALAQQPQLKQRLLVIDRRHNPHAVETKGGRTSAAWRIAAH